eukprot:scaffold5596_cov132-Skeletonema_dohrnii-CCMP3373.AAC.9
MEQVQSILERMVAPLKDLRDRGIFTQEEIHSIVQRRRSSEMTLQRRSGVRKSDYLRYIEEEVLLERLRKLRKQKVLLEMRNKKREAQENDEEEEDEEPGRRKKHAYQTSGPGDAHIVSHLHFIYQRTLKKFKYPIDVVLNYAQFARDFKSFHMMSRIYAEGLQHHPREEGLWIEAASFEFFGYVAQDYENGPQIGGETSTVMGSSIQNARVLMQRGLRINGKNSQELWLQYFALELHYVQKLRGRREILELGLNKDGLPLEDESEDSDEENDQGKRGVQLPSTLLLPSQIIFKNAIKAIPGNIQFRLRFVETCRMFPQTEQLEQYVMDSVTEDFGESVEGWVARISYADEGCKKRASKRGTGNEDVGFLSVDNEEDEGRPTKKARKERDPALALIDEALEAVPTSPMYLECARFLRMRIKTLLEGRDEDEIKYLLQPSENSVQAAQRHAEILDGIYLSANENKVSSTSLTLDNADFLLSIGLPAKAEQVLAAASRADIVDASLQLRWSQVSQRMEAAGMIPSSSSVSILRRALRNIPMHDRASYLMVLTELMNQIMVTGPPSKAVDEELKALFQKMLLMAQGSEFSARPESKNEETDDEEQNLAAVFLSYFRYTVLNNTSASRSIYTSVLYHSNYGKKCSEMSAGEIQSMQLFYDACIQFEMTNKPSTSKEKNLHKRQLCKLYESAVSCFSSAQNDSRWRKVVDGYRKQLQREKYSL